MPPPPPSSSPSWGSSCQGIGVSARSAQSPLCSASRRALACSGFQVFLQDAPPRRAGRPRTGTDGMRAQVVHDQDHLPRRRAALVEHLPHVLRPVPHGPCVRHPDVPPPRKGLHLREHLHDTVPHALVVHQPRMARTHLHRPCHLPDQLPAGLVHADDWEPGAVWTMAYVRHVLHARHELAALVRRNLPVFAEMRLKRVFFSVLQTVMAETDSTIPSSTSLSRRSLTVHLACPRGHSEQASRVSSAAKRPSNTTGLGGVSRLLRSRTASIPSSTNVRFRLSMVIRFSPVASDTSLLPFAGPPSPASSRTRALALSTACAECFLLV